MDFVIQQDGKDVTIQIPDDAVYNAVKDTHLPKANVAKDLDNRVQAIIRNQGLRRPEDLIEDKDFVSQILEKHAPKGNADEQTAAQLKEALKRQREEFEAKELGPLQDTLDNMGKRERSLLIRDLERQIIQAAAPYVKEGLLKSPVRGKPPAIVTLLEDAFAYDEDTNEFYAADGDNFVISGSGQSTYKTVEEYISEWLADKANAEWIRPGQGGADARGTGSRGFAGGVTLSREEASDGRIYQEALKRVGGDHSKIRVQ